MPNQENVPTLIVVLTLILWFLLVRFIVGGVVLGTEWQARFLGPATNVLLPLFNAIITVSLTYIFGKPIAKGVADRLLRPKSQEVTNPVPILRKEQ